MATYVLIHGAGSTGWEWQRVAGPLRAKGHEVVAPDLPSDDEGADLARYADVVVDAVRDRKDLVLVGQSLGGFTAPLVCARLPVDLLILVAAMVPRPGESAGEWWSNTGYTAAFRAAEERAGRPADAPFDPGVTFLHDVDPELAAEAVARGRAQSGAVFAAPWPLDAWPDVPTAFLLCRNDRFFPASFMREVVRERLGITPDEIDSGHVPALADPKTLVDHFERYRLHRADLPRPARAGY
jgi:pimeloyl-ACP methyl ester carboxylesterase